VAEVSDDTVECLWMGGEGDLFRETLPKAVLEAYEIDDPEEEDEDENEDDEEDEDDDHKKSKVA
jgi:hypothetical protein